MKPAIIFAALILTGCSNTGGNSKVCTKIIDPRPSSSVEESMANQRDSQWQRVRAEACVHRQAYLLAPSPDPAPTVAKAAVVYCENPIDGAAAVAAHDEIAPLADHLMTAGERIEVDERIAAIKASYEQLALSKVVEGRAGKCRA